MLEQGSSDDKKALEAFFTWLVALTKMDQTAYVFLVSSEEFFYSLLMKEENYIEKIYTIGNLSKQNANQYFNKIMGMNQLAISFDNLFKITGSFILIKYSNYFLIIGGNMSRMRKYIKQIQSRNLKNIEEVISVQGVYIRLIEYLQAFRNMNGQQTCKNLDDVLKKIISQGYYLEEELVNQYDSLFFQKLLADQQVYLFLKLSLKNKKTIFHYQKERPLVPDDLDDLGELGIQVFRCKNRCYLFD